MGKIRPAIATPLKNLLVFLIGDAIGMLATIVFAEPLLNSVLTKNMGLGVIVLAPFFLIFYSIIFGGLSGVIAVAIYNAVKIFKKNRASK
ncbi:MAG: hypothetical protein HZA25_00985 [Candidatus Niyogibacteria bacterium]|nr:hypothetical protein [Candidatus Niyogibacteria bacterium]